MMAESGQAEAQTTTTTTTTSVTLNVGYPTSWQGVLKIAKTVFLFCCLVCAAMLVNRVKYSGYDYCLSVAIIGLLMEILLFILYIAGVNKKWGSENTTFAILIMVYHIIMLVLIFVAVIVMTGGGYGAGTYRNVNWNWNNHAKTMIQSARAYNAFGIFSLVGFSLEIYFNLIWLRGGPELAALSIPGQ